MKRWYVAGPCRAESKPTSIGGLAAGKAVRVSLGPFADLEDLFREMSGRDRVVLLLNLPGRKVLASVSLAGGAS